MRMILYFMISLLTMISLILLKNVTHITSGNMLDLVFAMIILVF